MSVLLPNVVTAVRRKQLLHAHGLKKDPEDKLFERSMYGIYRCSAYAFLQRFALQKKEKEKALALK